MRVLSPPAKSAALPASVVPRNSRRLTPLLFALESILMSLLFMRLIFIMSDLQFFLHPSSVILHRSHRCFRWYRHVYLDFDRAFDPVFYDYALEIDEPITEELMQEF